MAPAARYLPRARHSLYRQLQRLLHSACFRSLSLSLAFATPTSKHPKRRDFPFSHGEIVHVAGAPIAFAAESDRVPANNDHFWITIGMGTGEPIRIALNTHSRQNAAGGFDPRLRIGMVASIWKGLPPPGLVRSP